MTEEKDSDGSSEEIKEGEGSESGDIRWLCASGVERGDMVCCDVCGGWSHISCIWARTGVSLLEGKTFCVLLLPLNMFAGST